MGNLLEFGGEADVILRAICDFSVNGIDYKKDDIVLMLNNVGIDITYNETIKDRSIGGRNIVAYDERKLNAMLIRDVSLTTDFIKLFAQKTADFFIKPVIERNISVSNTNMIYLTQRPSSDQIYIMQLGYRNIQYDAIEQSATITLGTNDVLKDIISVVYDTKIEHSFYDINDNYTLPYFKAQIFNTGNVDKNTGYTYIEIPRVSLLTKPDYSMNNNIIAQELAFKIINDSRTDKIELGVY